MPTMSKATVQPGQTLADIAIQYLGSEEGVFALASINELGVTDVLTAGQQLELPEVVDKRVRRVYELGGYEPAVEQEDTEDVNAYPGIGISFETTLSGAEILPGQTLADIAIQYLGSEEGVFALASLNNLNVTDTLTPGEILSLPPSVAPKVTKFMAAGGYKPASGVDDELAGISIWAINVNFIVSE